MTDLRARMMAVHGHLAIAALIRLCETAEQFGRLDEVPKNAIRALQDLGPAVLRWQGDEGKQDPGA